MKETPRSYNLRSKNARNSKAQRQKNSVTDAIMNRVCKKIAKTIYKNSKNSVFSSKICIQMAVKIEEMVQEQAEDFEDYKNKVLEWVDRFTESEEIIEEMSGKTESGEFEEWFKERVSVSNS